MRAALLAALLAATAFAGCASPGGGGSAPPADGTDGTGVPPADGGGSGGPPGSQGPDPTGAPPGGPGPGPGQEPAPAEPRPWPSPEAASIRPGVNVVDGSCTSNFVFTSPDNRTLYLGTAAHCVTHNDPNQADDGCDPASDPYDVGDAIDVDGANLPATLVYTSWGTMQELGEQDQDACSFNDFAVVELDPRDYGKVNPAMLVFGGPTGHAPTSDMGVGTKVLTYGSSSLRLGLTPLSPHEGYILGGPTAGGWTAQVYTVTQGIPGDSGSGVILGDGRAMGILVTISYAGGSNGVTLLENALAYAKEKAGLELRLATWEQLSDGNLPPL